MATNDGEISPAERERRRKISESKRGKKRPDLAARNRTPEMRNRKRVISDEARARMSRDRTKHGHARSRGEGRGRPTLTYQVWAGMIQRCTNPNDKFWADYGGRGIEVCDRWRDFRNFLADMGEQPAGRSIDRIDNEGNYGPGNCRWATPKEQASNTRPRKPRAPKPPRMADCHPDRKHFGRGMCERCWNRERYDRLSAERGRVRRSDTDARRAQADAPSK